MEISQHALRYFLSLAEELHFGRAAALHHITPPSLSQQIARLERLVGEPLFARTSRHVELTEAGYELVPLARHAVTAHLAAEAWAADRGRPETPLLRLGFVVGLGTTLTTRLIVAATEQIPGLRVELQRLTLAQQFSALRENIVDAVVLPDAAPASPDATTSPGEFTMTVLLEESRVLVVAAGHPLATRASVTLAETSAETYVGLSGSPAEVTDAWLVNPRPDGTRLVMGSQADDLDGAMELCAAGLGVNIAGASARELHQRSDLAFVPISDLPPSRLVLCSLRESGNPAIPIMTEIARGFLTNEKGQPTPLADAAP